MKGTQQVMFTDGADLPLFSGTAQRVEEPQPMIAEGTGWAQGRLIPTPDMATLAQELSTLSGDSVFWKCVLGTFELMDYAENAINRYMKRYPSKRGMFWDAFLTVRPTGEMGQLHERLYKSHVIELLDRIKVGQDVRPATKAEMLEGMLNASQATPLTGDGTLLYFRLLRDVLGQAELQRLNIDAPMSETYTGAVDELMAWTQRKLTVTDRHIPDPQRWESLSDEKKGERLQ